MSALSGRADARPTPAGPPTLLLAAHGTQVDAGLVTIRRIADAVKASLPGVRVELAYLDVLEPSLATVLTDELGRTVVVPALLSTGYHVTEDIPAVVGARAETAVSRHLGPDPKLTDALVDRLAACGIDGPAGQPRSIALVATGSSNPAARDDLAGAAQDLSRRLGADVVPLTLGDADVDGRLADCAAVATYLLAEGFFEQALRARAAAAGIPTVSDVLGDHPAVIELIVERYEQAAASLGPRPTGAARTAAIEPVDAARTAATEPVE